jgi:hypothetical protein
VRYRFKNTELKTLASDLELKDREAAQRSIDSQPEAGRGLLERCLRRGAGGPVDHHHDATASLPGDAHASA